MGGGLNSNFVCLQYMVSAYFVQFGYMFIVSTLLVCVCVCVSLSLSLYKSFWFIDVYLVLNNHPLDYSRWSLNRECLLS